MPRRPIPVGGYGNISYRDLGRRKVRALAKVRDLDGEVRDVVRYGTSREDARHNLLNAIEERPGFTGSSITADTKMTTLIDTWTADMQRQVDLGDLAPNTMRTYGSVIANHILPALGQLRVRELTTARADGFLIQARSAAGSGTAKTARTVLNGIMSFAVRQGAITTSPMREVSRVRSTRRKPKVRALTSLERETWLARMEADEVAVHRDIPDLTRFLLCTGCRIGEALAVTFDEFDRDTKTVAIDWTIVRVTGQGLLRQRTKSAAGDRTLLLPGWGVDMLLRRGERFNWAGPIFPVPGWRKGKRRDHGVWRDPSNTGRDFRHARDRAGFDWVTSHKFRRTVATVMEEAGMTPREIADQLGHAKVSMTLDNYIARGVASPAAAAALEDILGAVDVLGDETVE